MPRETITLEGFVSEFSSAAKGSNPRRFCFILGAGASISSGIKTGQQLVNIWEKELSERNPNEHKEWKERLGINEANMAAFYSKYYDRRFKRNPRDGYNYLENQMEGKKPSIGYVALAHLLATTPNNVVITTNFDHLAEDAISYHQQIMPRVIGHEALAHYGIEETSRPLIIKIHRDLLLSPKSEESAVETLEKNWEPCLSSIFSRYCPVFIGYAGNDKSLMDFLINNADKFKTNDWKCPYWIAYKTIPSEKTVLKFLDASDAYLILSNGFDDVMIELGVEFDFKLPDENAFLADSLKRYTILKDKFYSYWEHKNLNFNATDTDGTSPGSSGSVAPNVTNNAASDAYKKAISASQAASLYSESIEYIKNYVKKRKSLNRIRNDMLNKYDSLNSARDEYTRYKYLIEQFETEYARQLEAEHARQLEAEHARQLEAERARQLRYNALGGNRKSDEK